LSSSLEPTGSCSLEVASITVVGSSKAVAVATDDDEDDEDDEEDDDDDGAPASPLIITHSCFSTRPRTRFGPVISKDPYVLAR
jgi:hypothetical protein